jgi:hypothetical protein
MRRAGKYKITDLYCAFVLAAQLLSGCTNLVKIGYTDSPRSVQDILQRALIIVDDRRPEAVMQYIKNIQCKPISPLHYHQRKYVLPGTVTHIKDLAPTARPYSCALRFTSDCEVHLRNGKRLEPAPRIVSLLAQTFGANFCAPADVRNLEAEYTGLLEGDTFEMTLTEEKWLLFNKKTGEYFLYTNSDPDRIEKWPKSVSPGPW